MKRLRLLPRSIATVLCAVSSVVLAGDRLPLDQLKPGKWEVERTIRKLGAETTVRKTEYCASPKKEISRVLSLAAFLCKSEVKKVSEGVFDISASCNLPGGLSGTNHTVITLHSAEKYTLETTSKGTKFGGVPTQRSETISAVRAGDCQPPT